MNENEQQAPVLHNPVTVERQSALIALRALSQLWSDHVGGLDMEVRVAIEDLERVTGIRLNLVERR